MHDIQVIIGFIGLFVQFLAILIGIKSWKKRDKAQRSIVIMLSVSLIIQLLARELGQITGNSLWLYHINGFLEFTFIWVVFKNELKRTMSRKLLYGIATFYWLFSFFSVLYLQGIEEFPSNARFAESVIIIFFCISYFVQSLRKMESRLIHHTFMFWLSTGLLIYFTSNLAISLFANLLILETDYDSWRAIWSIHNTLNVFLYICFSVAFLQKLEGSSQANPNK